MCVESLTVKVCLKMGFNLNNFLICDSKMFHNLDPLVDPATLNQEQLNYFDLN